jgi:DNA-directed RNA polymerase specialized sigma24 family protein
MADDDITQWLGRLQAGDRADVQKLWDHFFQRLVHLAQKHLRGSRQRMADGEDVALSAFDSFCRAAERGRYPRLADRDSLWRLLATITVRKAAKVVERERHQKRGGGAVLGESALGFPKRSGEMPAGIEQVAGKKPTPQFEAELASECRRLLELLGDDKLRLIAVWRMEGYTVEEIAAKLNCVPRTVGRRLRLIRRLWDQETAP